MRSAPLPRWAISFADLVLLLLAFTLMVNMTMARTDRPAAVARAAPALLDGAAEKMFDPGEARLTPRARAQIQAVGAAAVVRKDALTVESFGAGEGAARFDRWELAAARTAAVARALAEGGLDENRIDIALPRPPDRQEKAGQRITIRRR